MKGTKICRKIACSMALFSLSTLAFAGSSSFASSDTFIVPAGVNSVRVLVIGGGGAGAGSHYRGGGSGYLNVDTVPVAPGASIPITVGTGGLSAGCAGNSCTGGDGGASSFGVLLQAAGGIGGGASDAASGDGNGGSGGGGAGNSGFGGAGGSAGSDGVPGSTYPGGVGQGTATWTAFLGLITESAAGGGAGVIPSTGSNQGGGGGGGILLNGSGPSGGNAGSTANHTGAFGGIGFGAGGGSGGYNGSYAVGGNGAPGLVYVEWGGAAATVAPVPTLSAYGLVLTMLGLLFVAGRRLRGSAQRGQSKVD